MSIKERKLIKSVESLPTELQEEIPEELEVKDKEDLKRKLEEGLEDIRNGKMCTVEDAFEEIDKMLE